MTPSVTNHCAASQMRNELVKDRIDRLSGSFASASVAGCGGLKQTGVLHVVANHDVRPNQSDPVRVRRPPPNAPERSRELT